MAEKYHTELEDPVKTSKAAMKFWVYILFYSRGNSVLDSQKLKEILSMKYEILLELNKSYYELIILYALIFRKK